LNCAETKIALVVITHIIASLKYSGLHLCTQRKQRLRS